MITRLSLRGLGAEQGYVAGTISACKENFWSAACWFGPKTSQDPVGSISTSAPPLSNCAGVLSADGSCAPFAQPNDPGNSTGVLTDSGGNFQNIYASWVGSIESAVVPQGGGVNWWLVGGAVALVIGLTGGVAAGRHLR